jgi:hypothetical protein
VAILSGPDFDATAVVASPVLLGGANVAVRGKGKLVAHEEDVNADGLMDLVVQVETEAFAAAWATGDVVLTCQTSDGAFVEGSDVITVVPPE